MNQQQLDQIRTRYAQTPVLRYTTARIGELWQQAKQDIETLIAELPRWIPVEEALPADNVYVLFVSKGMVYHGWHNSVEWLSIGHNPDNFLVSHWMPLPEKP